MAPQQLLDAAIAHWEGVENGTHYVRDASFGADACQIRKPTAARNMVTLRDFAIGLHCLQKNQNPFSSFLEASFAGELWGKWNCAQGWKRVN